MFAVCLFSMASISAQNEVIDMAVAVPQQQMTSDKGVLQVLRNKLSAALPASGCSQSDYGSIIISPSTTVSGKQLVEGGMKTITVYDVTLTVSLSNIITGTGFNTMSMNLRGEGYSEAEAVISAVNKLSNDDVRLVKFLSESRKKIIDYYKNNRKNILIQAQTLANMQQYDKAIALLASYPANISGYDEVAEAMTNIYNMYMIGICSQLIQSANGAFAVGKYDEAIDILNCIDMQSPCAEEVVALTEKVRREVDAEKQQTIDLYLQEMQTAADMEKRRLRTIENIAVAYYQRQRDYYFIF